MTSSIDESYVDVTQVGAPGRATWGLLPKLLGLILVLTVLGWGAISVFALHSFERTLLPELHLKAATVGRSMVSQIGRPLDHGVPPEALIGMPEFLESTLAANPEVSYLVVANEVGRALFAHGAGVDEAIQRIVFFKMPEQAEAGSFQTFEMGSFYDTSVPIIIRGDLVGYLHVGVRHDFLRNRLARVIDDLVMLLIAASIMSYYMVQLALKLRLDGPIAAVRKGMFIGAVRDFRFRVQTAAIDDTFRVSRNFNLVTRRLSESYQRLLDEAEESKAAQIDPVVSTQIDDAMLRFRRRFRACFSDERTVITDDVPLRGVLPLFLLSIGASLVIFFQADAGYIAVSASAFMAAAAAALAAMVLPGAQNYFRLAYQPGLLLAAVGLVGSTFEPELFGTVGWNLVAGLGFGGAVGAALLGMSSESTADNHFNPGPALLGATLFAVTVHAVTSGAGHVASDWLVVILGVGALVAGWSTGWPNPVSTVGMQIGDAPEDLKTTPSSARGIALPMMLVGLWTAGMSAMLLVLLPQVGGERGLLHHPIAMFIFFLAAWAGVTYVVARRGHLVPLRLVALVGGLCAALGMAQLGHAGAGAEGLPKLASFLIGDLPGGAAWLGFAAFTLGQSIALGPLGMLMVSATSDPSWRPDRLRQWALLLMAGAAGFCVGPLATQFVAEQGGFVAGAWVAAGCSGFGALLILTLPAYRRRPAPIMIDTMWRT